jgi:hypothetical protein
LTKKWSKSILGPLIYLTSSITPFLIVIIISLTAVGGPWPS